LGATSPQEKNKGRNFGGFQRKQDGKRALFLLAYWCDVGWLKGSVNFITHQVRKGE